MHFHGTQENLQNIFTSALTGPCSVKQGDSVLTCVSGGIDSMVLLDLMLCVRNRLDLRLGVIHVDHGLRGDESGRDARFVQDMCKELSLEFHLVELHMDENSGNLEEEARKRRYDSVQAFRQSHIYDHAATGHTLDDQAETVLYRITRGTGIRGLSGMEYRRPDGIIRPMLGISRSRVVDYAFQRSISYVNDRTNENLGLARNLIRSAVIPVMKQINTRTLDSIASLATIARDECSALDALAVRVAKDSCALDWEVIRAYRLCDLLKEPDAVLKRMLINVISHMINEPRGIESIQVEAALDVIKGASHAHTIRRKVKLIREGNLFFMHNASQSPHYTRSVDRGGPFFIPEINKTVRVILPHGGTYNLLIRSLMRGDKIGGRKVTYNLSKMKIPCTLRSFWPVLVSQEGVVAVAVEEDDGFKVTWEQANGR